MGIVCTGDREAKTKTGLNQQRERVKEAELQVRPREPGSATGKLELWQPCPAGAKAREETISHLRNHPRWRELWPQVSPHSPPPPQSHASASHWPITEGSQWHRSLGKQTAEVSPLLPTVQIRVGWGSVDVTGRERMVHMVNRLRTLTQKSPPNPELSRGQGPQALKIIQSHPVALEYLLKLPSLFLWNFLVLFFSSLSPPSPPNFLAKTFPVVTSQIYVEVFSGKSSTLLHLDHSLGLGLEEFSQWWYCRRVVILVKYSLLEENTSL